MIESLHEACDGFSYIYLFQVENMRNNKFKELREQWPTSRFFMGKNKVMQVALGKTPSEEYKKNLFRLATKISGSGCGLLFSNNAPSEVVKYFEEYEEPNFARSGFQATHNFLMPPNALDHYPVSMEPQLRQLGLPTRIQNAKITVPANVIICKEGDVLTPEQCKLLELFDEKMAVFKLHVVSVWHENKYEKLKAMKKFLTSTVLDDGIEIKEVDLDDFGNGDDDDENDDEDINDDENDDEADAKITQEDDDEDYEDEEEEEEDEEEEEEQPKAKGKQQKQKPSPFPTQGKEKIPNPTAASTKVATAKAAAKSAAAKTTATAKVTKAKK